MASVNSEEENNFIVEKFYIENDNSTANRLWIGRYTSGRRNYLDFNEPKDDETIDSMISDDNYHWISIE